MNIFTRIAAINGFMPNNFFTKAYDCRMLYILSGRGKITIEGKEFPLKKDTLCYYPPGTEYFPEANRDAPLFFVTINFDLTRDFSYIDKCLPPIKSEEYDPDCALRSHLKCDLEIFLEPFVMHDAHLFRENIKRVAEEKEMGNEFAASSLLQYVCYKLAENSTRSPKNRLRDEILNYISQNYASISTLNDIADALSYHPYYLNKVFREVTGETIHKYILNFRLNKSAELLRETDYSIRDVSVAVGFKNPDHFSKCFSNEFCMSPSAFRKKNSRLNYI